MDWLSLVAPGLAGGFGTLFSVWLVNWRGKDEAPRTELKTGRVVFWFLLIFSPILMALGVVGGYDIFIGGEGDLPNPILGIVLGLFLIALGTGGLWQANDARHRWANWDDDGITINTAKHLEHRHELNNISDLHFVFWMQAWQIEFSDGSKFLFFDMMSGSKELLELCNAQLGQEV